MKKGIALLISVFFFCCLSGQQLFPINEYQELAPFKLSEPSQWQDVKGVNASWGDIDMRYDKTSVPVFSPNDRLELNGWRGERVQAQAIVWTAVPVQDLNYEITDLKGEDKQKISAAQIRTGFVRYVMGDTYFSNGTGCGKWAEEPVIDSVLVADCIDHLARSLQLAPMQTQGIWLTCQIPSDIKPGQYCGKLIIRDGKKVIKKLDLTINASAQVLPKPQDWHFHLDLWQNPFAVSRYHQVENWSPEHFEAMRPLMTLLAQAGQKTITTTLIHKPWGGQTHDHFESMVEWIKKKDGSWEYKFDILDKWVEFMFSCGITEQISCFSIAPWDASFRYFDEASGEYAYVNADVGTKEYEEHWTRMLKVLVAHLKTKGWFEKCVMAIDERPMEVMLEVIKLIKSVEPGLKIALAGNYHPEIEKDIYDYCIAYKDIFPADVAERRKKEGKITTYYTCCTELAPNLFTISDPADGLMLGLEMARRKSDGYLRWAYNSWPLDPLKDSRFHSFTSGDTFLAYPGGRSSIRMERLVQGIQEYEKLRLLGRENSISVIPQPMYVEQSQGELDIAGSTYYISSDLDSQSREAIAGFMNEIGIEKGTKKSVIRFDFDGSLGKEAYRIHVGENGVQVKASTFNGNLYSIQTLKQLLPLTGALTLPYVEIYDTPRFGYRGMHLDVARHFYSVDQVKKYLDMMAIHKMNTFHWHLTDDQGWRVEIKKYPKLVETGSHRKHTAIGKGWYNVEYDTLPHGGYYTQEEIREVVAYAASKGITVIPEIDFPGHMLAALASYPELGCTGGPYEVWGRWGTSSDVLCAGKEVSFEFLENVLMEIMDMFPSKYIHIGGDECPRHKWMNCPACQAKMKELGIDGEENAGDYLQSYMVSRIEDFLAKHGRSIIGWDEILAGGVSKSATIMSWRGTDGGIAAAKAGNDAIMTPNHYCYFDYYQSRKTQEEPFAIGGFVDVPKVYSYEPFTEEMTPQQRKHILGVQANLWTEYIKTPEHLEYMLLPRMSALSEVQWCQPSNKDYDRFLDKMSRMVKVYQALGYNYSKHIFEVIPIVGVNVEKGCPEVTLTTQGDAPMYYTLDGSEPTAASERYVAPVSINAGDVFKAIVVREDMPTKPLALTFSSHKAVGKAVVMNTVPYPLYSAGLPGSLVNGVLNENQDAAAGEWMAWKGAPVDVVIDMAGEAYSSVSVRSFVSKWEDMYAPLALTVYGSEDGVHFTELTSEEYPIEQEQVPDGIKQYDVEFPLTDARYLKVVVKTVPALPQWSERTGKPAYLFIDEIKVN